jgi:hypothetical protein
MEKSGDVSLSVDDYDDVEIADMMKDSLRPPDELDHYEFNETEDLDDKNAIRFILKVRI